MKHKSQSTALRWIAACILGLFAVSALAGTITCPHCGQSWPYPNSDSVRIQGWLRNDHMPNCPQRPRTGGGQPSIPQGPSEAELAAERQRQAEAAAHAAAREANQKGVTADAQGDLESAVQFFEQAASDWPANTVIQQNLAGAKDKVSAKKQREREAAAAREKFQRDKQDAISSLKGIGDTDSGLKGIGSTGLPLKGVDDYATGHKSSAGLGLKDLPTDLRDAPNSKSTTKKSTTAGDELKSADSLKGDTKDVFDSKARFAGSLDQFQSNPNVVDLRTPPINFDKLPDRIKKDPRFVGMKKSWDKFEVDQKESAIKLEKVRVEKAKPDLDKKTKDALTMQEFELKQKSIKTEQDKNEAEKKMRSFIVDMEETDSPTTPQPNQPAKQ